MTQVERQARVQDLLKGLNGLEPLKKLFWSELNYDRVSRPLSRRTWNQTAANALAEDPVLFAGGGQNNDFHVVYSRLSQDKLLLGQERPVVTQLLREHEYGLFIFSNKGQTDWHFINVKYDQDTTKRRLFRRIRVGPQERLRTAAERVAMIDLQEIQRERSALSLLDIQSKHDEAFDVEAVTEQFFEEYKGMFTILEDDLRKQTGDHTWAHDYSLQLLNRCMFIYFVQRKGWLGGDHDFLLNFWKSYQHSGQPPNSFVDDWLKVLFFEAFRRNFNHGRKYFPDNIRDTLSTAPYLNGGLFTENKFDQQHKANIVDRSFEQILKFLERYNFTVAEDSPLDKEVAVDPEMIGKVYESLVNVSDEVDERGEAGIFYTPRTEIDLMCRLSLVDHLSNHLGAGRKELLYQLVFALEPDEKTEADGAVQAAKLWAILNQRLRGITVLDPACGSGSFLVGMLNILDDLERRANAQLGVQEDAFVRKKRIIGQSLYGVDVMEWACHIAELRLWLSLIIDAEFSPEDLHVRTDPLLPHFSFKVRCGDSLVQEVGGIDLSYSRNRRHVGSEASRAMINDLKREKVKFYDCEPDSKFKSADALLNEEKRVFSEILKARQWEIQEETKVLRRKVEGPIERRIRLDGVIEEKAHQMDLNAAEVLRQIDSLNEEYRQVQLWASAVQTSPHAPFVWDVAFVEVFSDGKRGFDIVVGNPPYVRQEAIAAPFVQGVRIADDKKEYKGKLATAVYRSFPSFFGHKAGTGAVGHKLDAKSDLYVYFYFRGLSLLDDKGSFSFITSNSWLDVGYGADLQEFLLKHCHVKMVLDNQVKRSFKNADVNTVIALLSAPDDRSDWALDKLARFVMFRAPFEHIVSPVVFDEIEEAKEGKTTKEYRVFPVLQGKLLEEGCDMPFEKEFGKAAGPLIKANRYAGNKWGGKYLRAPDIYWKALERLSGHVIPFDRIIHKDYGIKPGCVEFFYVDSKTKDEFGIDDRYLVPLINSSKSIESIYFGPNTNLFYCHEPKDRLDKKTLAYVTWGEGQGFNTLPSTRTHSPFWYSLTGEPVDFLLLQFWDKRFWTPIAETNSIMCSNNFFYGRCLHQRDNLLVQMNSSWYFMQIELFGRANQGQGVLTTYGPDYEYVRFVAPAKFTSRQVGLGQNALNAISRRKILPIREELKQQDRRALDDIVFNVIGLTRGERDEFYFEFSQLVSKRLERASSLE